LTIGLLLGIGMRGRKQNVRKSPFLWTTLVTRDVKEAIKRAGFTWRPYVLRAHTATARAPSA
jgi:hypothetical protein